MAASSDTTCASRTDGSLWCWGKNSAGQVGDGSTTHRSAPVQAGTATTWTGGLSVTDHGCGIRTDGGLWCWGDNSGGQLGDGTTVNRSTPGQVTVPA
nr:hypothetical protein [Micromonospora provocatoris]